MESRNVALTLEKAREWYKSGSADLREIALQAYTKEELRVPDWKNIKTLKDACSAKGLRYSEIESSISDLKLEYIYGKHLEAVYVLDIIRKALNKDWKPSLVEGAVYYPYVRFYPADKAKEAAASNGLKVGPSFIADGKKYTLVGGDYNYYSFDGLANFGWGSGDVLPYLGLLGCQSREIAEHMSKYFMKEIFEATYAHHWDTYHWV